MSNVMVDTNVFIYDLDETSIFHRQSSSLLKNSSYNFCISSKCIAEYFSVCSNLQYDFVRVWNYYLEIKNNISTLFPTIKSLYEFELLYKKYKPIGKKVYDMEIVSIMLANNIKQIATINKKDFQHIKEISLFDF